MLSPVLRYGDQGKFVEELQDLLNETLLAEHKIYYSEDIETNGKFGPHTKYFVERFQSSARLKMDGVVGKMTWAALRGTEKFNCYDEPYSVKAADDFTCWAAATAMLKKLHHPDTSRNADARVEYQSNGNVGGLGNDDENMKKYARHHNFGAVTGQIISCEQLGNLLTMFGRLMINMKGVSSKMMAGNPNDSHLVVVGGMRGDGTPKGTTLMIFDTSPDTGDAIKIASYSYLKNRFPQLTHQCFYSYSNRSTNIY